MHASHREQRWEPPSWSLIERDPEVIPDVEHSVLWKEKEASKVFTSQGLTTCTEVDKSWTIMISAYNQVRSKRGKDERSMAMFIRWKEVEHQELLEAAGYRSPSCRVLRALQSLLSATQLQGESAVAAPPFFPNAGRGTVLFWGTRRVESAIVALGLVLL